MAQTKIKAGLFEGVIGNGTDGYFLMSNGDGTMTWSSIVINPTITSIAYPGSVTAADPAGGETITVTGTGFKTGATVTIGGTAAPAVSYVSATQITFTTPAKAAGDYDIVVTNTDTGSATYINGISYNGIPTWTTPAGSLGTFASNTTISTITLQATEPDAGTITFSITNGALPTGLSLTGANIDGTTTLETADTLYTFTVTATDDESQATPRTFTITVTKQFIGTENFTINTYTGNGSTQSIEGKIGTAAQFNGSNSYISTSGNISGGQDFSISLWVYLNTDTNEQNSLFTMGSTSNNGFFIYRYNQQLALDSFGATRYSDATFFTENTWQHLVVTHSSGTNNIYLDGSFVDTFSYTWNIDATATTYLGAQIGSYSRYLNGKLDQVRIFDKALSSSEVTTLYGENNTSTTKSTTDIFNDGSGIALYEFEEAAKDTGGVNGYIDAAGVFNGSSSYIPISQGSFDISTMSLGSWFNTSNTSQNYQTIFNNYSQTSGQNRGWYVRYETGGNIRVRGFSSSNSEVLDALISTTINQNEWYHIVVTITSTEVKIYKNGSQIGTTQSLSSPIGYSSYAGLPTIGAYRSAISTYANYFNGKIDQVRIFNKALSSSEVTTLYGETSASATKSTTDIFDDGSGVALYELEGNANDSGRFGRGAIDSGQSAVFNGTTSIFNFPNTAYGASTTVFTVSGWFKHTSAANSREDIYFGNGATVSGNTGYALFTDYTSGNIALSFRDTDQSQVFYTSSSNIKDGSWYHLCLTYNNGAYVVYLNGASILNGTSPDFINNQTPTYATYIGNRYGDTGANRSLVGAVDQVRVYSSALSASDVKALISEINVPTTNLTAHYKLDGNANDETGTYNGTASNLTYSDPAEFPTYDGTATNVSYAYDGTPTNVSFVGTSFEPDLVWIKSRSNATSNELHDSVRGEPSRLFSNLTNAESANYDGFVSMDSNGFNLDNTGDGGQVNFNGRTYVAWCWKAADTTVTDSSTGTVTTNYRANTEAGFSIVKFVGASGANYVPHGLSQAPELFIMKSVNVSGNWGVYVKDLGADKYLLLNSTADAATSTGVWNNTHPTSELLHWQGGLIAAGGSGQYNNIAYCFHSVDGYQKVGSYSGNGATGNFINVGFRPRFVMIKSTTASSTSWVMIDSLRDNADEWLYANESSATFDDANTYTELNSNGFTVNSTASYVNASGNTYIYLAIA